MNVRVVEYNNDWPVKYRAEAEKLKEILDDDLVDIHHFGSTSVPGLKAKPIIDIMPIVKDIEKVDMLNEEMSKLGYECLGEFGIEGRRYFRKGGNDRTHHVHVFQSDNAYEIDRHLSVRDFLRTHPKEMKQYGDLKESLAKQFPKDIEAYMEGKDQFVKDLERKAMDWYIRNKSEMLK